MKEYPEYEDTLLIVMFWEYTILPAFKSVKKLFISLGHYIAFLLKGDIYGW